ncbi:unnamed protein product [Malus baccata var. baccata]
MVIAGKDDLHLVDTIVPLKLRYPRQDGKSKPTETTPLMPHNYTLRNDGVIPQLFTSVLWNFLLPTLNDVASYLSQTTSLFTRCFTDDSVEPSSSDSGVSNGNAQELVTFWSRPTLASLTTSSNDMSSSGNHSSTTESSSTATDAPSVVDGKARGSAGDSSRNSNALIKATNGGQSGIPIFQGLIDRVGKTVHGSADDIGWLQRDPTMPPVEDSTERFMEILGDIRHGVHRLPNSMVCLLVPISWNKHKMIIVLMWLACLFSNHGPLYFVNAKMSLSKLGLVCHIAKIHRGIDAAAALSLYWPDLKDKVAGLALAQSPYGGSSSIATDILREGQLGDYVKLRKLMQIVICQVIKISCLCYCIFFQLLYSSLSDNPSEADASQVCEALLALLVKAGQNKRRDNGTKDE